jgi:hypothetical protein
MTMAEDKNIRAGIPPAVRAQLWVAAAGRCQFNSCNKPLDRNVLTQQKLFMGQHAHIIGDSVKGPRGDAALSKKLSQDVGNIMLTCRDCHWTIDRLEHGYSVDDLQEMKRLHEERIQALYDIGETKVSVPVVLRHPIRGHVPQFTNKDVQAAILANSKFMHMPSLGTVSLDYRTRAAREDDPDYWAEVVRQLETDYNAHLHHVSVRGAPEHFSVFAFAPIPLLMQLGAFMGNKAPAAVYQWTRGNETWKFQPERKAERQVCQFGEVPPGEGRDEIALLMSFSGEVDRDAVEQALPGRPQVRFGAGTPNPNLVEDADDVRHFRTQLGSLLASIRNAGYRRVHVFPAMPLSFSVEFGRQLLPKADPAMEVWDYQQGKFVHALRLKV